MNSASFGASEYGTKTECEEDCRARITAATGAVTLQLPVFGDLRLFRNDAVYRRRIASEDNSCAAKS
jgi:hypothetical protein